MKCCRALLAVPAAALVLASSVVLHGTALVAVVVATGLAAWLGYALRDDGRAASVETAWQAAAGVFAVIVLIAGVAVVAGGAVATVVGLVGAAAAGAFALRWGIRARLLDVTEHGTAPPHDPDGEDADSPGDAPPGFSVPVSLLPSPVLAREWRRTGAALATAREPTVREEVVRRRQALLDEIERRDPGGFARWLAAGAPPDGGPRAFQDG